MARGAEVDRPVDGPDVNGPDVTGPDVTGADVNGADVNGATGAGAGRQSRGRPRPTTVLIRGGSVVDAGGVRRADVLVADGRVVAVGPELSDPAAVELDAGGCVVTPAFVDLHTHLREPGGEDAETIESGTQAAALGGYGLVVAMPNTDPPIDSAFVVHEVRRMASEAVCEVEVAGTITVGRRGERLAPLAELAEAGVRLVTDDGRGVQDGALLRRALEYARPLGLVVAEHCEDEVLAQGGLVHEGDWSDRLGLRGQPVEAEVAMALRDLALAARSGARLHLLHVSSAETLVALRAARAAGVAVTAEVTPHHLTLTDAELARFDPVVVVKPPLRGASDVEALVQALGDETLDAVATDHAPHADDAKDVAFEEAPPGMTGLETAFALLHTELVVTGRVALTTLLGALSWRPGAILRAAARGPLEGLRRPSLLEAGADRLRPGAPASLCVLDPTARWRFDPACGASRARNSPFVGREFVGRVRHTLVRGEVVVRDAALCR